MTQQVKHDTPCGTVIVQGPISSDTIDNLTMNNKLHNFRPPKKQKEALKSIADMDKGMIYAACAEDEIIGYITFHPPDEFTRWIKHPRVLEMGGIEISSDWRRCKIAENILKLAFSNPVIEDYIVITMEFCWHWDLNNSGLDIWEYQRMLTRLFGKVGMSKVYTDDPDILEHPANVLLARFGSNVSKEDRQLFESMTFEGKLGPVVNLS